MRTEKEILEDFDELGCRIKRFEDVIDFEIDKPFGSVFNFGINIKHNFVYIDAGYIDSVFIPLLNELLECIKEKK